MPVARNLENLCVQKRFDSAPKLIDSSPAIHRTRKLRKVLRKTIVVVEPYGTTCQTASSFTENPPSNFSSRNP